MQRIVLMSALAFILMGSGLIALSPRVETRNTQRMNALERWKAQAPNDYRIVVQIRLATLTCFQELEIRGGEIAGTIHDTCNRSWLGDLTIERLFELSTRLERPPECFPSSQDCVCQRLRVGNIDYNPRLGYPQILDWRREVRPNWIHTDYWERLWTTRNISPCTSARQRLYIAVTSLTPLN